MKKVIGGYIHVVHICQIFLIISCDMEDYNSIFLAPLRGWKKRQRARETIWFSGFAIRETNKPAGPRALTSTICWSTLLPPPLPPPRLKKREYFSHYNVHRRMISQNNKQGHTTIWQNYPLPCRRQLNTYRAQAAKLNWRIYLVIRFRKKCVYWIYKYFLNIIYSYLISCWHACFRCSVEV